MARRILLVDDDIAAIATVRRVLSREGLQVLLATSAADAGIAVDHHEPEVVLLAPSVDGRRGAAVRRHIRESRRGDRILVLLLGASEDPAFAGDPTFEKPVDPLAILSAIRADPSAAPVAVAAEPEHEFGWSMEEPGDPPPPDPEPDLQEPDEPTVLPTQQDAEDLFAGSSPWEGPPAAEAPASEVTSPPSPSAEELRREEESRAGATALAEDEDDVALRIDRAIAEVDARDDDPEEPAFAPPRSRNRVADPSPREYEELRAGLEQARADAETLRGELEQARADAGTLRGELDQARADAETLRRELEDARSEGELGRAGQAASAAELDAARTDVQAARAAADRATRELAQGRVQAEERLRQAVIAARADLEAAHREHLERALGEARAEAVQVITRLREDADAAAVQARAVMQEKARRAVAEAVQAARGQAEAERGKLRHEIEEKLGGARAAVEEARRTAEKTRAAADAAMRRLQDEHGAEIERAAQERAAVQDERDVARSAADALHARGEELRRRIAELESTLEEERARHTSTKDAAVAALRRGEAEADRRLREEVARMEVDTRRTAEDQLRREAQAEAERRADARRQAALESRRTPVPGLPPPSALIQHLRAPTLVDVADLPLPTSLPVPADEPFPGPAPGEPLPPEGEFVDAGRVLARLARTGTTGRLDLFVPGGRRTIWLERGRVVGADSDVAAERLEELALREGLLSREQRAWARTAPAAGPRQLAAMLSERGYLKAAELVPLVRRRVADIIAATFERDGGRFTFAPDEVDPEERVVMPESTLALVTSGIRRKHVAQRLHARLGGPGTLLRTVEGGPPADEVGLSARERKVVALADGLRTLDEILLDAGAEETAALAALWSAVVAGSLEVAVRGVPAASEDGSLERARIEEKYRQVQEADYFYVLGVSRTCTAFEVDAAFERLSHEYDPARHAGLGDPAALKALQEIQGVLSDAREVLRDDRLRLDYARNLGPTGT